MIGDIRAYSSPPFYRKGGIKVKILEKFDFKTILGALHNVLMGWEGIGGFLDKSNKRSQG
jgi:hypothetical protein